MDRLAAHPLDRPVWNALRGPQELFAMRRGAAVRFQPDVNVFAAAEDRSPASLRELATLVTDVGAGMLVEHEPWPTPPGTRAAPGEANHLYEALGFRVRAPMHLLSLSPL